MGSTHLKAWLRLPSARVTAVASDIPERLTGDLSSVQGNIGGPGQKLDFSAMHKYADALEAVRDPDVDAVDICLPTNAHAPVAIAALEAGKHVLIEKPMALNAAQTGAIIAAARASGRVLMVAQVVRFIPAYRAAADMVRSGRLGPVRSAIFRRRCAAPAWGAWMQNKAISGGGVFDLLIHDIDFCLHAFGIPEAVSASGYEDMPRGIDWIAGQLHYPDIGAVVITGGWHHPKAFPFSSEFSVIGDCGTVEFSTAGHPATLYRADGVAEPLALADTDFYQAEIEYFLECCEAGRAPDLCPPEESAAAVNVANLLLESRCRGGVKLEL